MKAAALAARRAALAVLVLLALNACRTTANAPGATAANAPASRLALVDSALAMLGQPYRYGGAAPGGFDCSGLVVYAAAGAGLRVPRTAEQQEQVGVKVPRSDLQPGDLVFMHLRHKELHVAIALDRERFVHAPSTGGQVRIDNLNRHIYSQGFIEARRIVGMR